MKPYLTENKNNNGKIFWAHCLTECHEGSGKRSMDDDIQADRLKIEDEYVTVEWGMEDKLI